MRFELGPLKVHWYGLTYLAAFATFYFLANWRARRPPLSRPAGIDRRSKTCCFWRTGVVLGGRLGYVLFYKPTYYLAHPAEIFAVWQGGMAFHGGLLGVILAMYLYGRKVGRPFSRVADLVAPCVPIGLAAGRIGNFINGELWGRALIQPCHGP